MPDRSAGHHLPLIHRKISLTLFPTPIRPCYLQDRPGNESANVSGGVEGPMTIPVVCPNGHRMSLPDFQAGKRFRCPLCYSYLEVPLPGNAPPPTPVNAANAVPPPPAK